MVNFLRNFDDHPGQLLPRFEVWLWHTPTLPSYVDAMPRFSTVAQARDNHHLEVVKQGAMVLKKGAMVVAEAVVVAVKVHRCQIEKESPEHDADSASLTWNLPQHSVVSPLVWT
jgi:hypothetical protein